MPSAAPSRCRDPAKGRAELLAAAAQLEPALPPAFTECVAILQSHADPGPGDVDRAVRQALIGLWSRREETKLRPPHWHLVTRFRAGIETDLIGGAAACS